MKSQVFISLALSTVQACTQRCHRMLTQQRWLYKAETGTVFRCKKNLLPLRHAAHLGRHRCCHSKEPIEESSNSLMKRRMYQTELLRG